MKPALKKGAKEEIISFIREKVRESGAIGVVLNLSGGIDSALVLKLCVEALGRESVHAVILPDRRQSGRDEEDATLFANSLGVHLHRYYIGGIVGEFASVTGVDDRGVLGNIKARTRMVFAYIIANSLRLLVAGTSNKSELLTGYYTKYGDGASDFCAIGDLFKTEVRELAAEMGIPPVFLEKTPSAGLWPGQSDEGEMGVTYGELDAILLAIESGEPPEQVASKTGVQQEKVGKVLGMLASSRHKRRLPDIPKMGTRSMGID